MKEIVAGFMSEKPHSDILGMGENALSRLPLVQGSFPPPDLFELLESRQPGSLFV